MGTVMTKDYIDKAERSQVRRFSMPQEEPIFYSENYRTPV